MSDVKPRGMGQPRPTNIKNMPTPPGREERARKRQKITDAVAARAAAAAAAAAAATRAARAAAAPAAAAAAASPSHAAPAKYQEFSEAGKTAWNRAMSELEVRLHKTPITADEVAAMYGDVRLAKGTRKLLETAKNLHLLPNDDAGNTIHEQIFLKFEHYCKQHAALKASLAPA